MTKHGTSTRWLAVIVLWLLGSAFAHAALPTGISGPWYNPAQSGHGLSVEILAQNRALVFWYVYDAQGNPVHLYIEGQIVGHRIEGTAYAPRGMRFGEFDPADRELPRWGSVNIDFTNCTNAILQWTALSPEYGSGQMPIRQLTPLADLACELPQQDRLPTGLYEGVLDIGLVGEQISAWGFVDRDGKLWAIERWRHGGYIGTDPGFHQGQYSFGLRGQYVSITTIDADGSSNPMPATMRLFSNSWYLSAGLVDFTTGQWITSPGAGATAEFGLVRQGYNDITHQHWQKGPRPGIGLFAPISIAQLQDVFELEYYEGELIFQHTRGQIQIDPSGSMCVRVYSSPCDLVGKLEVPDGDIGLVQFELRQVADKGLPPYRGRGWLSLINGQRILTLTGNNGSFGLGLVGRAVP
jgi:hypothetical protein